MVITLLGDIVAHLLPNGDVLQLETAMDEHLLAALDAAVLVANGLDIKIGDDVVYADSIDQGKLGAAKGNHQTLGIAHDVRIRVRVVRVEVLVVGEVRLEHGPYFVAFRLNAATGFLILAQCHQRGNFVDLFFVNVRKSTETRRIDKEVEMLA